MVKYSQIELNHKVQGTNESWVILKLHKQQTKWTRSSSLPIKTVSYANLLFALQTLFTSYMIFISQTGTTQVKAFSTLEHWLLSCNI